MPPVAVLLDMYDTVVAGEWRLMRDAIAERLGVDARVVGDAFRATRPGRNVGRYGSIEGDMAAMVDAVGLEPLPELVRDLASLEFELMEVRVTLHDDVLPFLAAMRRRGIATALVSNCSWATRPTVERLGFAEAFDALILSCEVGAMKPQPEIYEKALSALGGVHPADALFVDDQTEFCDGAAVLGIETRLIVRPGQEPPDGVTLSDRHPVIHDLRDLVPE
jgi:putative hydrolase of the HAD superfamily